MPGENDRKKTLAQLMAEGFAEAQREHNRVVALQEDLNLGPGAWTPTPEEEELLRVAKIQGLSPKQQQDVARHKYAQIDENDRTKISTQLPAEGLNLGPGELIITKDIRMESNEETEEAQREAALDPLMQPHLWPMLERPGTPEQLAQVLLAVVRTRPGRILMNELVVAFLLADGGTIPAERQQGHADVVRYLLQHLGLGLTRHQPATVQASDTNPWRDGG